MKTIKSLVSIIVVVVLLSACSGVATPASSQNPAVENTPQIVNTIAPAPVEPATTEPVAAEPTAVEPTAVAPAVQETTLKIINAKLTSFAPIFIAEKEGYFKEFGIKLDFITLPKSSEAVPLILSGDIDIYPGSINAGLLNILGQEKSVKVVADRGHIEPGECTYLGILVRKDLYDSGAVTNAAGLAGKVISSAPAGSSGFLLSKYLEQAGLTIDDVTINEVPTAGWVDTLANKTLDGIVTPELHITRLKNTGNAVVLAGAEDVLGETQLSVMVFGKKLMVDDRDAGARFLAGYLKGVKQYNEGKTERNLQIIAEATGESVDTLKAACWVPIREDGSIQFSGVDLFQQWSVEQNHLEHAITEEQFWDPSLLAAALKLLNP